MKRSQVYTVVAAAIIALTASGCGNSMQSTPETLASEANIQQKNAPLPIPAPDTNRRQSRPRGSADYLVWQEEKLNATDQSFIPGSSDIMGLDIRSGKVLTITAAPCDQYGVAISGSFVVWHSVEAPCSLVEDNIRGKDLDTGETYEIATGPNHPAYPDIADKTVVWVESNEIVT